MPTSTNTTTGSVVNYRAARTSALRAASAQAQATKTVPAGGQVAGQSKDPSVELRLARVACAGALCGELRVDESGREIWRWDGGIWQAVAADEGRAKALAWIEKNAPDQYRPKTAENAWATVGPRLSEDGKTKPAARTRRIIVPTRTAYLEVLDDGRIVASAPDRELGLHHRLDIETGTRQGTEYRPQEVPEASRFGRYLAQALPDPAIRALVQEQVALTMTPGPQRSVLWMFGPAGGGKGTMSTIIQRMHVRSEAVDLHRLDEAEQRYKCVGASLLTCSEVGEKKSWAEAPWKAMVAGDAIDVRQLYGQAFTYRWTGKMVIDAQQPPYFEDKTRGVADRLVPVLFGSVATDKERTIDLANCILDEELHLVADWVLAGLQRIAKRGGKPMPREEWPEQCRAILEGTRTNNDPLREWLVEVNVTCDETLPARPKSEVEAAWAAWAEDNGYTDAFNKPKLTGRSFWTAIRKMPEMLQLITGAQDETVPDPKKPGCRTRACRIALGPEDAARLRAKAAHEAKARAEAWSKTQVVGGTEGMPF